MLNEKKLSFCYTLKYKFDLNNKHITSKSWTFNEKYGFYMKTKIGNPEINNLKTTRLTSIGFPDYVSLPLGTACAPPVGHKI